MFEVAVIGAGPSGAIAAKTCAENGLKTVLVEKETLPRDKPCGGLLSPSVLKLVRKSFGEIPKDAVETPIEEMISSLPSYEFRQSVVGVSVYRRFFDYWLTQEAEKAGSVLRKGFLRSLLQKEDHVDLKLQKGNLPEEIKAKYVVGADGVGSAVCSSLVPRLKRQLLQAYQTYAVGGQLPKNTAYLFFPIKEPQVTYFWMIPKKQVVVLGVGGLPPIDLKKLMRNFLSKMKKQYSFKGFLRHEAYPIPMFSPTNVALGKKRAFLVGDAASLANPFTGEGIFNSLKSGKLASEAIIEHFDEPFQVFKAYERKMKNLLTELNEAYTFYTQYQSLNDARRQDILKTILQN
jgi:geranylgeranyl reductase family protein